MVDFSRPGDTAALGGEAGAGARHNAMAAGWEESMATDEDKEIYIKDGKEAPLYKSDSKSLKHFGKFGFLEALNYINII